MIGWYIGRLVETSDDWLKKKNNKNETFTKTTCFDAHQEESVEATCLHIRKRWIHRKPTENPRKTHEKPTTTKQHYKTSTHRTLPQNTFKIYSALHSYFSATLEMFRAFIYLFCVQWPAVATRHRPKASVWWRVPVIQTPRRRACSPMPRARWCASRATSSMIQAWRRPPAARVAPWTRLTWPTVYFHVSEPSVTGCDLSWFLGNTSKLRKAI